ncbi:hypothetical protein CDL60_17560 [Roseateles noduli]|nr:hypothetical protein CDL60_17560 [Roseateles noduli]
MEPGILRWETMDGRTSVSSPWHLLELPGDLVSTPGTLRYWQQDFAGNASEKTVLDVDVTAPEPLLLDAERPANGDGQDGTVRMHAGDLTVIGLEPRARWRYSIDGGMWLDAGGSTLSDAELRRAGRHDVRLVHVDEHGNESDVSKVQIEVAGSLGLSLKNDTGGTPEQRVDHITSDGRVQVDGVSPLHGKVEYRVDGGIWQRLTDGELIDTNPLRDGNRRIEVRALDANDVPTATEVMDFVVDRTRTGQLPLVVVHDRGLLWESTKAGKAMAYVLTNTPEVRIVGAEPGSQFSVNNVDADKSVIVGGSLSGVGEFLPTSLFKQGAQFLGVSVTDPAGNLGGDYRLVGVWLDTLAPPAPDLTVTLNGQGTEVVDVSNLETQAHLQHRAVGAGDEDWTIAREGETLRGPREIRQMDRAGNASAGVRLDADQELHIHQKTAPPEVPQFSRTEAAQGTTLLIPTNLEKDAHLEFRADGSDKWKTIKARQPDHAEEDRVERPRGPGAVRQVDAEGDISLAAFYVKVGEEISLLPNSSAFI